MNSVRELAAKILLKTEIDKAYSSISLNENLKQHHLNGQQDVALLTNLVYGVCERKITIDYNLSLYLKSPLKKLHPAVLTYLRLGAFQILFADRIPDSAAINESVELAKRNKLSYASGLINAVLRKISSAGLVLPDKSDRIKYMSVFYSCPVELTEHFAVHYGEDRAEDILRASIGRRPVFIKVNTTKISPEKLEASLMADGVSVSKTDLPGCLRIDNTGDISALRDFKAGNFFVQDKSSQLSGIILDAGHNEKIVDCCAAPGGKTFSVAVNTDNKSTVYSCDIYPHKTDLIEKGAELLGLSSVKVICTDARKLKYSIKEADRVLCDVPCSGFGVIGRKPEIKYKSFDEIKELPALQLDILENCSEMVKNGGILLYSTCTLNPAENDFVCDEFLSRHKDFSVVKTGLYAEKCNGNKYITVFPEENNGDGFFIAEFIRGNL